VPLYWVYADKWQWVAEELAPADEELLQRIQLAQKMTGLAPIPFDMGSAFLARAQVARL
jgi:hypothetical protein